MSLSPQNPDPTPEPVIPEGLVRELSALYRGEVPVPAAVDAAVLSAAREGWAARRRRRMLLRWAGAGTAAAAAAAVTLLVLNPPATVPPAPAFAAGDVDRNGRIDILDAFVLAKKVQARQAPSAGWEDVNGDGMLDRNDVEQVAAAAVQVASAAGGTIQ